MNDQQVSKKVREIVGQIAKRDQPEAIGGDQDVYRDLGVQSTAALELLLSLEDEFGVSISDEDFGEARTVDTLSSLISGLL